MGDKNLEIKMCKTKGATMPQTYTQAATIRCYNHTKCHANLRDDCGEMESRYISPHTNVPVGVTTFTAYVNLMFAHP